MTKGIVLLQENARSRVAINHVVIEAKIIQQILIKNHVQYSTDIHTINTIIPTRVKNLGEPGIEPIFVIVIIAQ